MVKHKSYITMSIIALLLLGGACDGYLHIYHHVTQKMSSSYAPSSTNSVSANSTIYQQVRKNDLKYLYNVGNKEAKITNKHLSDFYNKNSLSKYPIYHPDKHGNYWSYLEDHKPLMSDDYDLAKTDENNKQNDMNNGVGYLYNADNAHNSGQLANEKILRKHGVNSGINFAYGQEKINHSDVLKRVKRNDLKYLHTIGNRKAIYANKEALSAGVSPLYHKDKYGNYWDYFKNHQSLMFDDFDVSRASTAGGDKEDNSDSTKVSGIIANEKILREHGVHFGVNFAYYNR